MNWKGKIKRESKKNKKISKKCLTRVLFYGKLFLTSPAKMPSTKLLLDIVNKDEKKRMHG